ncbi:MAG TPA: MBL fold metallo-hydrolase [Thermoanaerobaculaceae bacterium]|nr:MBL fold metallo-hydrolase [Thermoanaerobaculaceae bacterium]HPS77934.1 MBL fold metallo-hydrolase [Thermoanaerobaculaceae bacterium]
MINLTFLGATGTVTGSRYLVEAHGTRVLIDAGMFQGPKDLRLRNWAPFPVEPSSLDTIILTHAHIDHTGVLPLLVRQGFGGPTLATPPTLRLLRVLLPDAAHLQEEDARYANKVGATKHTPALPLFDLEDVKQALRTIRPIPFGDWYTLHPGMHLRYHRQGHILGAGAVELRVKAGGEQVTIYFSGDVGRYDAPILPPPEPYSGSTYLVVESTYGDRLHAATDPRDDLAEIIKETVEHGGVVLIPAFAIDRTQEVLYYLRELVEDQEIPPIPIYVDSPMAREATAAYRDTIREHDVETRHLRESGVDPLVPPNLTVVGRTEESKRLNDLKGPAIIISASGMATGGRILHHLRHRLSRPDTTVLFVGYQAEGTRGRAILEGAESVKIFGEIVPVRAQVRSISSLSAHADADELEIWLARSETQPRTVFVTHGEPPASLAMAERITRRFGWPCTVPTLGESFHLV